MWSSSSAVSKQINCGLPPEIFFFSQPPAPLSFHSHHPETASAAATINFDSHHLGVGVIPLLTATPYPSGGMQQWQGNNSPADYQKKSMISSADYANLIQNGATLGGPPSTSATSCLDCGNQAKKDCSHGRCRTCCNSRGFNCATHVKSTWVPASRRRERQVMNIDLTTAAGPLQSNPSTAKKPRLASGSASQTTSHTSTSNTATMPRSFDTISKLHQDEGFKECNLPGQVKAPAVFKCVRVTAVDDGRDNEHAYQAIARIGGHVFKGFLYDRGFEGKEVLVPNNGPSSSHRVLEPTHDSYAGALIGVSSYINPIN